MAYGSKYYDYQVAIIFAMLALAIVIVGAFIFAIYYVVVDKVRTKKPGKSGGPRTRTPSSLPATRTTWQPAPQPPQHQQLPTPYSPADFERRVGPTHDYNYDPRLVSAQPGYVQQPLVQNYVGGEYSGTKIRELQPEYVYQQVRDGPVTWTSSQQVHEGGYPVSPVHEVQATTASAYHMSSV